MTTNFKIVEVKEIKKGYSLQITKEKVLELVKQFEDKDVVGLILPLEKVKGEFGND